MKLHSLLFALTSALTLAGSTAAVAHAQGALYVNPIAVRASNSTADTSTFAFLGKGDTSRMFYGVNIGGYYDIPMQNKSIEVGIDVHDANLHGNNALLNSFLLGPRIAFRTDARLHPYINPEFGAGTTRAPNTAIKVNKIEYGIWAGADYNISRRVNWRVLEVGYSRLSTASAATIGATTPIPSATLFTITTGLTFRLP